MSDATPLSPAEAVVMLRPNVANGLKAIKVTILLLLSKGILKLEQSEKPGLFGSKKIAHLRIAKEPPADAPAEVRAVMDIVRAAQADDGRLPELVKRASKMWGAAGLRFVTELVRPALIARGLLSERQLLFIRTYHPTPEGDAERQGLEAELTKVREIPKLLKSDPAKAAAIAAAAGIVLLLDDNLPKQFKPLADAMRVQWPDRDYDTSGNLDFGNFDLGAFDLPSLDTFDAGMSSFDAGFSDGGGAGGDGGGGDSSGGS